MSDKPPIADIGDADEGDNGQGEGDTSENGGVLLPVLTLIVGFLGGSGGMALGFYDRIFPQNEAPNIELIVPMTEGVAPHASPLIASVSDDGGTEALSLSWAIDTKVLAENDRRVSYEFQEAGTYVVSVSVEDEAGLSANATQIVTVRDAFDQASFLETENGIRDQIKLGDFGGAIEIANSVRYGCEDDKPHRECARIHGLAAEAHKSRREYDYAIEALKNALRLDETDVIYRLEMANTYILNGNGEAALTELQVLLDKGNGGQRIVFNAALAAALQGDYDAAEEYFQQATSHQGHLTEIAQFAHGIFGVVSTEMTEFPEPEKVKQVLCYNPRYGQMANTEMDHEDPHMMGLQTVIMKLDPSDKLRLHTALEGATCT